MTLAKTIREITTSSRQVLDDLKVVVAEQDKVTIAYQVAEAARLQALIAIRDTRILQLEDDIEKLIKLTEGAE